MTGLRREQLGDAYSGGTVRDSHTVHYSSFRGGSPRRTLQALFYCFYCLPGSPARSGVRPGKHKGCRRFFSGGSPFSLPERITIHAPAPKVRGGGIGTGEGKSSGSGVIASAGLPGQLSSDMFRVRSPITAAAPHGILTRFLIKRPAKGVPSLVFGYLHYIPLTVSCQFNYFVPKRYFRKRRGGAFPSRQRKSRSAKSRYMMRRADQSWG